MPDRRSFQGSKYVRGNLSDHIDPARQHQDRFVHLGPKPCKALWSYYGIKMRLATQILFLLTTSCLIASPWEQDFKDFKPSPPPWLLTGRKATPGVDYYDPRKPYKFWVEEEIRNHDVELQRIIKVKMSDDIKNRRNRSGVKPRSFPWRCKVYRCEP